MELNHSFTVNRPVEEAWAVLTDVERIAPCLPGAQLQEIANEDSGDVYRGVVKVKLGAIQAQFKGEARFAEKDDDAHKAVLTASGRDTGGRGNAAATITATLESVSDEVTTCSVHTDLSITGKVANFGRGVLNDVSDKLLAQFSANLNDLLATSENVVSSDTASAPADEGADSPSGDTPSGDTSSSDTSSSDTSSTPRVRTIDGPEAEPIDLLEHAGLPVAKMLLPIVGGLILVLLLLRRRRRR
jgi:uncharacterized protein